MSFIFDKKTILKSPKNNRDLSVRFSQIVLNEPMRYSFINQVISFRLIVFTCSIITLLLFSCTKKEVIIPPDTNPTEVVLFSPESNTSNNLTFYAEVKYLNNSDLIQSHGFFIEEVGIGGSSRKEYPITTALKAGPFTFKVPDAQLYKTGTYYMYSYFVKTEKGLYTTPFKQFTIHNLKLQPVNSLMAGVGETIIVNGEFENIEKDYDLYYSQQFSQGVKIPFEVINAGKSIRFTVPEGLEQGNNIDFRLSGKDKNGFLLTATIAYIFIVTKLPAPQSYTYYYDDLLKIPYVTKGYNENKELKIFIGNVYMNYNEYLKVSNFVLNQKGKTFPIGYTNGRDTVTFPEPIRLIEPDPNEFSVTEDYVHPGTEFEVTAPNPDKFNFYSYVTVGNKRASYLRPSNGATKALLTIGDLPEGEYPMEMVNNHFTYKTNNKIKVKKVNIVSISHDACYTGDKITLKGTFVKGQSYSLILNSSATAYSTCNTAGELSFEIPFMQPGKQQLKLRYENKMTSYTPYYSNAIPLEIKSPEISTIYPLRATKGDLITMEGHGMYGYTVQIADVVVQPKLFQNNKIQFEIPANLPKGKYRINLTYLNYQFSNAVFATDYLEIY